MQSRSAYKVPARSAATRDGGKRATTLDRDDRARAIPVTSVRTEFDHPASLDHSGGFNETAEDARCCICCYRSAMSEGMFMKGKASLKPIRRMDRARSPKAHHGSRPI